MTQKEIITEYLKSLNGEWVKEYNLRAVHTPYGWIGSSGDRRCRELAEEGIIERRISGKYAEMRIKPRDTLFGSVEKSTVSEKDLLKYR